MYEIIIIVRVVHCGWHVKLCSERIVVVAADQPWPLHTHVPCPILLGYSHPPRGAGGEMHNAPSPGGVGYPSPHRQHLAVHAGLARAWGVSVGAGVEPSPP